MAKRYYWLKLPDNFFQQKPIKKLRKIAGGDTYTVIYLKMLLVAIKQDGRLYFDGVEDDFYEELALELDEDTENVRITVQFLLVQGLMELIDESQYLLSAANEMVGSETSSAKRVREYRDRKALQCNTDVTQCNKMKQNGNGEKKKREEIDTREEIEKNVCTELKDSVPNEVFISLPLVTGSGTFDVMFDYLNSLRELYPAVDVEQALRNMKGWLDSNPRNRKTKNGIKRFITGWLSREQDRTRISKLGGYTQPSNRNMTPSQYMEQTAGWYSHD